jgi:hypothetical protein
MIPAIREKINLLKETIDDTQDHYTISNDKDARIGHKSADSSFFGYKTHLAITEERIITPLERKEMEHIQEKII